MGTAPTPPGLIERIMKMVDERIARFARSGFLRNARISGGSGLTIADGGQFRAEYPVELGGGLMLYLGRIVSVTTGEYTGTGLLLQAPDGTDMVVIRTDAQFGTTMHNIYDSGGRIILGNDAASGQGLARPYIGGGFARARYSDWSVDTTSSEWETLFERLIWKQHPRLEVALRASMDTAGTTGEVRVLVDGVPFGAETAETYATSYRYFGPAPIAGDHMEIVAVEIQGRRTSATGALRVEPRYWMGRQS